MKLLLTVQYILDQDSRVMDEVGFRISQIGFRIPGTGFRIPKPWIPDSKGKKCWIPDSGFPYMGRPEPTVLRCIAFKVIMHLLTHCSLGRRWNNVFFFPVISLFSQKYCYKAVLRLK